MTDLLKQIEALNPREPEPRCTCNDLAKMRTFCPIHEKDEIERMNRFAESARKNLKGENAAFIPIWPAFFLKTNL